MPKHSRDPRKDKTAHMPEPTSPPQENSVKQKHKQKTVFGKSRENADYQDLFVSGVSVGPPHIV